MQKRKSLSERDHDVIWHPYTQQKIDKHAIGITHAKACMLYDESGNQYLDAASSWWVNIHGHANPYIAKKVSEQLYKLEHVIFAGFTHEPAVALAERLLDILPDNQKRAFYTDNGSTAVESGIKMCLQYWHNQGIERNKLIAFRHAYHGDTFGAMSVSERSAFTNAFKPQLFDVCFIDPPVKEKEDSVLKKFEEVLQSEDIAAFIFEPLVMGASGMLMYEPEILDRLIALCKKYGVLCIADEVMTGFGRTGKLFASNYLKEKADVICMSKGITGGTMPLGLTTCTDEIYKAFLSDDRLKTFFHGHSYTANPLACTAGLASLDLLLDTACLNAIAKISEKHAQFKERIANIQAVKEVRHRGTIIAIELNEKTGKTNYFSEIRDMVYSWFIKNGILMRPLGNVIYIMPPYCITDEELDFLYKKLAEFLNLAELKNAE